MRIKTFFPALIAIILSCPAFAGVGLPKQAEVSLDEYEGEKLVPVMVDDIIIFIPAKFKKKEIRVNYGAIGDVYFDNTRITTVTVNHTFNISRQWLYTADNLSLQPTLFLAITGTSLTKRESGNQSVDWSKWMAKDAIEEHNRGRSQFIYGEVVWNSRASNRSQAKKVANKIKDFLNARSKSWDVVIMGHSRGGIFAHVLTTYIKHNRNLRQLHALLLDATAATVWGDKWPHGKDSEVDIAVNYDDGKAFVPLDLLAGATVSDQRIPGYERKHFTPGGCGGVTLNATCSHIRFPDKFVQSRRFRQFLDRIYAKKSHGLFPKEDIPDGFDINIVDSGSHMFADVGGEIRDNTFYGHVFVVGVVAVDVMIGEEGIGTAYAIPLLSSAHASITKSGLAGSVSFSHLGSAGGNLTERGAEANISIFDVSAYQVFGKGKSGGLFAEAGIGGEKVEMAFREDGKVVAIRFGNAASFVITEEDVWDPVDDLGKGFENAASVAQKYGRKVASSLGQATQGIGDTVNDALGRGRDAVNDALDRIFNNPF